MESAHQAGVVHRDLKPSNVLIFESPPGTSGGGGIQAKIIDFGQARAEQATGPRMTVMGAQLGTAGYAAPEQLTDARGAGIPADIFSLGTILYELVCARPAFYQKDNNFAAYRATLEGKYAKVDDVVPDCPMHVASAITRALEYDASARFQSCSEFALALYGEELRERPPATPIKNPFGAHRVTIAARQIGPGARRASRTLDRSQGRTGRRGGVVAHGDHLDRGDPRRGPGARPDVPAGGRVALDARPGVALARNRSAAPSVPVTGGK